MERVLHIVTGKIECGKTRWLTKKVSYLRKDGKVVAGVLAPGIWYNKKKQGIDNIILPQKKLLHLAIRKPYNAGDTIKKWKFNNDVINEVNTHFLQISNYDTLVVDELGPLELENNTGIINALVLLKSVPCNEAFVVIRPHLTNRAKMIFSKWDKIKCIDISKLNNF